MPKHRPPPPPPPPPLPTTSIEWGSWVNALAGQTGNAPWSKETLDSFERDTGKKIGVCHWGQPWGVIDLPALGIVKARGAVSMVDHGIGNTSLAAVARGGTAAQGGQDDVIDAFARKCASFGGRILYRPWWEFNGQWYAWGRSTSYVDAWRRLHDRVKAIAPNVEFVWCANTFWDAASEAPLYPRDATHPNGMYPGDAYVDWLGMDGYNAASLKRTTWKSPYDLFKPTYDRLVALAPGKPIAICETASTERDGSKAAWITNLLGTALPERFKAVKLVMWFNWPIVESGQTFDWPIESSASAQAAFKAGIASPYYKAPA